MTAHPDPTNFVPSRVPKETATVSLRPNVTEQFWGYEVRMNETLISVSTISTRVRVQVDTVSGEIREVIDAGFGRIDVLASYGVDAVRDVRVVSSALEPDFAQIHADIEGFGTLPLADGAIAPLRVLSERISADCGLLAHAKRVAEWTGPIKG